ncbi:MAG: type II toxin-antitoxin system Phd/YefM family antitoxin [Candidatus Omnitrophica bacterium]|nr:type II toxin-antitoxin system Phd/YefM family antitoxin [Candidatus Omnitrophota bacterium]MCA9426958.1 type II toxin-antitoxin system Phd/YefM family antitoxin [Candidatus Omnitrophota bacterium]MCA9429500.1 type II toxin-antitoxin system Phd/YefM family antitoxin [Candidatus Omnitrophota bacterium]MCB9766835.1 type II toxin-antitoxin system Phd/YefM family antitoxin [Candidatus Omnitrophota bacterium]
MTISKFKATCLSELEKIRRTGEPLLITKRGVPIAQVVPPPPPRGMKSGFGCMRDSIQIHEDIVGPVEEEDWESLK